MQLPLIFKVNTASGIQSLGVSINLLIYGHSHSKKIMLSLGLNADKTTLYISIQSLRRQVVES
jgi:hypothetical protein